MESINFIYAPFILLPVGIIILYILLICLILLSVTKITLRFLPLNLAKTYQENRRRFKTVILICSMFLYVGGWAINRYCFPHRLHPVSLIGDTGILLFTIFLGWGLLDIRRKKKIISIGIAVFTLFIFLLTYISSRTYQYLEPSSFEALKSLPYLTWVPAEKDEKDIGKRGVTIYNPDLSYKGLNLYTYDKDTKAYLTDMSGKTMHTWLSQTHRWHQVEMYDNGDLLGIVEDESLLKLDWDSKLIWIKKMRFHHDVDITKKGDIYAIAREDELILHHGLPFPILNDYILILSADGEIKKKISLYEVLKDRIPLTTLTKIYGWIIRPHIPLELLQNKIIKHFAFEGWFRYPSDIFHTNTVERIDRDIEGFCKKGDLLICVRNFDIIGILDVEKEKLIWQWGPGDLRMPHHPTLLENGNILIFDNGWERKYSRVVELNPITNKIVWEYKSSPPEEFFSLKRGANQRLPNGNTLITESDKGHVFEVTPDGRIVWEFYSPDVRNKERKAIYRMMRITDIKGYPLR